MTLQQPSKTRYRNSRGITLIEVLVSMAIMAMLVTIAFSGLRVGLNGWERGEKALDDMDRRTLVERLIRRQLAVSEPITLTLDDEQILMFRGSSQRLEFISDYSLADGSVDFRKIDYAVQQGRFLYGEKSLFEYEPADVEEPPATVLATFQGIEFSYLGQDEDQMPAWLDEWPLQEAMPSAVRIQIDTDVFIVPMVNR